MRGDFFFLKNGPDLFPGLELLEKLKALVSGRGREWCTRHWPAARKIRVRDRRHKPNIYSVGRCTMAHIIAIKGHSLKCPPGPLPPYTRFDGKNLDHRTRERVVGFFGIFMRFSGFLFTFSFLFHLFTPWTIRPCRWWCACRVRDKTDRSDKNAVKRFYFFFILSFQFFFFIPIPLRFLYDR